MSDENRQENESNGDAGFSQSDIDARLEQGGEDVEAAESAADNPPPSSAASVSQSDIDALMSAAHGAPLAADDKTTSQPEQTPHEQIDSSDPSPGEAAIDTQNSATAQAAGRQPPPASTGSPVDASPVELSDLNDGELQVDTKKVTMLNDVNLRVKLQLGKTRMLVEDILNLGEGSVVELDKLAGDPIDVLVNDRLIARGEVLVLNDNFCVRISEVLTHDPHRITT